MTGTAFDVRFIPLLLSLFLTPTTKLLDELCFTDVDKIAKNGRAASHHHESAQYNLGAFTYQLIQDAAVEAGLLRTWTPGRILILE